MSRDINCLVRCLAVILVVLFSCHAPRYINLERFSSYYILANITNKQKRILSRSNSIESCIIYQKDFDSNNDAEYEPEIYLPILKSRIRDVNSSTLLVLDWEGRMSEILKRSPLESSEFENAINELIDLIKLTKKARPNVMVGYYGIPFRIVSKSTAEWINRQQAFKGLLREVDVIFPSVYDRRPDDKISKSKQKEDFLYIRNTVELALRLGLELNKHVIPFVWHRYHKNSQLSPLRLIPASEFNSNLKAIQGASYNNKSVSGIVWWGPDKLFYKNRRGAVMMDVAVEGTFDKYFDGIVKRYSECFVKVFNQEMTKTVIDVD